MGGGLGIALAADIRIASEDSVFGVPAARLSIAYDRLNLGNLVALVGPSKAKEILITARRYSALEAERMGLVNSCVPIDKLEAEVADITMKDDSSFDEELVDQLTRDCFNSRDYQEGQEAFMNKRQPVFHGK